MSEPAHPAQHDDGELRHLPVPADIPEARPVEPAPERELERLIASLPAPAMAAAGGFLMGVVSWVAVRVLRAGGHRSLQRRRRARRGVEVAATRSFLVDVHVLRDR